MTKSAALTDDLRMNEETLYSGPGAIVTTARAVLGPTTYPIAQISAVRVDGHKPQRGMWLFLFALGIASLGLAFATTGDGRTAAIAFGAGIGAIGGFGAALAKAEWKVVLATSGGQVDALVSEQFATVSAAAKAITDAIVRRTS